MIKNSAIVTALYDIGRDKWKDYKLTYDTYLYWMDNILNIDSDIIIFTEKKFLDRIISSRKKIDINLERTKIILNDFVNLDSYLKYYDKIKTLMGSDEFKKKIYFKVPEMVNPEYNTVIFNKFNFIKESMKKTEYDLYVWCDAGMLRDNKQNNKKFPNLEKINKGYSDKVTFFSHSINFKINNRKQHLLSQYRYIHGGCFFVPKISDLNYLIDTFEKIVDEYLNYGFVGSEEKYYDFCYEDNKEKFNIVKSDWREYFKFFG